MDQQTLHSLRKCAGVARQAVEQSGVTPGIAHGNRSPVPIELHPNHHPEIADELLHHEPAYRKLSFPPIPR
jgi:hypothetical protein